MNLKVFSFDISECVDKFFITEDSFIDIFSHLNRLTTKCSDCKP